MTYEKALKIAKGKMVELVLQAEIATENKQKRLNEEYAMLMKACTAMEKQMPKEYDISMYKRDVKVGYLNIKKGAKVYSCPECEELISPTPYCPNCGQALKGSEEK